MVYECHARFGIVPPTRRLAFRFSVSFLAHRMTRIDTRFWGTKRTQGIKSNSGACAWRIWGLTTELQSCWTKINCIWLQVYGPSVTSVVFASNGTALYARCAPCHLLHQKTFARLHRFYNIALIVPSCEPRFDQSSASPVTTRTLCTWSRKLADSLLGSNFCQLGNSCFQTLRVLQSQAMSPVNCVALATKFWPRVHDIYGIVTVAYATAVCADRLEQADEKPHTGSALLTASMELCLLCFCLPWQVQAASSSISSIAFFSLAGLFSRIHQKYAFTDSCPWTVLGIQMFLGMLVNSVAVFSKAASWMQQPPPWSSSCYGWLCHILNSCDIMCKLSQPLVRWHVCICWTDMCWTLSYAEIA